MSTQPAVVDPTPSPAATPNTRPAKPKPGVSKSPEVTPSPSELRGAAYANRLRRYITEQKGQFLRDEAGNLFVFLHGRSISLNIAPENFDLSSLLLRVCNVTTVLCEARIAIERLQYAANESCSDVRERRFSACSEDEKHIYIPIQDEKLLEVSGEAIRIVPNVTNEALFWIRHPEKTPFRYTETGPQSGLSDFERLLVTTLSCKQQEMRWFIAMHEGLFPFVRDTVKARLLVTHEGGTQQGKTTGAQRFTLLHGLGDVTGDGSVAGLCNQRDTGLLVLDNKEQKNLTQPLIDFCLFLSTGARRLRSSKDGSETYTTNKFRPAGVITSIEGVHKAELAARNVSIPFSISGQKIGREDIERKISEQRHHINSALVFVLQRFLVIRAEHRPTPNPRPGFDAHFTALCDLLRAFGEVAGKPPEWAEGIIAAWNRTIPQQQIEAEDSEFEYYIRQILYETIPQNVQRKDNVEIRGQIGTLFILQCGFLLGELRRLPGLLASLPKTPQGFSNRLATDRFRGIVFLRESDAPEHLKRKNNIRFIGFFDPSDKVTPGDDAGAGGVTALTSVAS